MLEYKDFNYLKLTVDSLSTYKELITCIFYATPNTHKSCTMYETWVEYRNEC